MAQQNALNLIIPISSEGEGLEHHYEELKKLLEERKADPENAKRLDSLNVVHFARFLFLGKDPNCTDEVYTQFALFTTYDGDLDKYTEDFARNEEVRQFFEALLKHLKGGEEIPSLKKDEDIEKFQAYVREHNRQEVYWYNAYREFDTTVVHIKEKLSEQGQ